MNTTEQRQLFEKVCQKTLNFTINAFALENITFGTLRIGEKIPFDEYFTKLNLLWLNPYKFRYQLKGIAISDDDTASISDIQEAARRIFNNRINFLFASVCKQVPMGDDFEPYDFAIGFKDFTNKLFLLFWDILNTETTNDKITNISDNDNNISDNTYFAIVELLSAIKMNKLRQYSKVDKYIKKMSSTPNYIERLVTENNKHYFLKNINEDNLEFKISVLHLIQFIDKGNTALFRQKLKQWEEMNGI